MTFDSFKIRDKEFFKDLGFWIISFVLLVLFSFLMTKSIIFGMLFFMLFIGVVVFWKPMTTEKNILILILLSILPGMLGRISFGERGGGAILITDLLVTLLMFIFSFKKVYQDKKLKVNSLTFTILSFFLIALLSFISGVWHLWDLGEINLKEIVISLSYLLRFLGYSFIFFYLIDSLQAEKDIIYWTKWLFSIGFVTAILGFLQLIFYPDFFEMFVKYGWDPHKDRLLGTFFDPNLIGAFLALNMCVILGIVLHYKNRKQTNLFIFFVMALALVLTLSRSAYLAFFFGFIFITFLKSRKLLISGLLIIVLGVFSNPTVFDRISQGISVDESASKHIESWVDGIHLISAYPLLGIGYNMLPSVYDDLGLVDEWDINNRSGIENSFMTVWVTCGLLGIISYLLIHLFIIRKAFLNWNDKNNSDFFRGLNLGVMGGWVALFVSALFVNTLFFSYIVVYFWIYASFVFLAKESTKKTFFSVGK